MRIFWRLCAWLVGGRLPVERFDFAFPSPTYASSYGKIFPAPLRFDQQQTGFWFSAELLQQPLRRDKAAVRDFLADARANVIVPRRKDSLSERVRNHLQRSQPAWPDLGATADALHMAASALQRRLAADGTSFQALKDALRRDLAIVRLNTSDVPLTALAFDLGFADSAAFQRAFKRWTGSAPGAYRRRAVQLAMGLHSPISRFFLTSGSSAPRWPSSTRPAGRPSGGAGLLREPAARG